MPPLLLYLHGGPGDAALLLVMKYNKELEKCYTVVIWEQRGAGKSYYEFDGTVTIDDFLQDIYELTKYLLDRFLQSSIYLLGHSWGVFWVFDSFSCIRNWCTHISAVGRL